MLMGDDNRAILSYSEVANLFLFKGKQKKDVLKLENEKEEYDNAKIGNCFNNIACI
jgi:hypothetical protein